MRRCYTYLYNKQKKPPLTAKLEMSPANGAGIVAKRGFVSCIRACGVRLRGGLV